MVKYTCIGDIRRSHNSPYLLHRLQIRTQTTMHCKNLLVDDSSDWQTVETVCKGLPQFDIVPAFTYFVDESFQKMSCPPTILLGITHIRRRTRRFC